MCNFWKPLKRENIRLQGQLGQKKFQKHCFVEVIFPELARLIF